MMKLKYVLAGLMLSCMVPCAFFLLTHEQTYESFAVIGEKEQSYDAIVYGNAPTYNSYQELF